MWTVLHKFRDVKNACCWIYSSLIPGSLQGLATKNQFKKSYVVNNLAYLYMARLVKSELERTREEVVVTSLVGRFWYLSSRTHRHSNKPNRTANDREEIWTRETRSSCATASKATSRTLLIHDIYRTSNYMFVDKHKIFTSHNKRITISLCQSVPEAAFFTVMISANTSEQKLLKSFRGFNNTCY
jgi:hypothetical protein